MSDETPPVLVWELSGSTWHQVGQVHTYDTLTTETRHLQPGTWALSMPFNNQAALLTRKRAITVDYRGQRFTGIVETLAPQSDEKGLPILEASGQGALALLGDALIWPVPANVLSNQTATHYTATGVAETVLRNVINANIVTRRSDPITVPASGGHGTTIHLHERFSNLLERVLKKAGKGGIGIRMGLVNTTSATRAAMTVEFYVPTDRSGRVRLSHKVGTLRTWKQSAAAPTGTRAIVGGSGKGTDRIFRAVADTPSQTVWGRVREFFVDARDATGTDDLDERGADALLDAAAQSSFELEATDAEGMRYGTHFAIGDLVTVELLTGVESVEPLTAVKLTVDSNGPTVQLVPGNPDGGEPMFKQAAIIRGIRQRLRNLEQEES